MKLPGKIWTALDFWAAENHIPRAEARKIALEHPEMELSDSNSGPFVRWSAMPMIKGKLTKFSKTQNP